MLTAVLVLSAFGLFARLLPGLTPASAEGLAICAAFGLLVWLLRAATPLAALTGFLLTSCLYLATVDQPNGGWFHTALLARTGAVRPRLRRHAFPPRPERASRPGRIPPRPRRFSSRREYGRCRARGARAAAAYARNTVSSILVGIHGWTSRDQSLRLSASVAALAEAAADTVSSEIGQAIGGTPFLITNGRRVPPGTDGAISLAGTAAGCLAAALVVAAAIPTLRLSPRQAVVAWIAAIAGLFADSLIGATLERRGWLNNDAVNFLSTAIAALIALVA